MEETNAPCRFAWWAGPLDHHDNRFAFRLVEINAKLKQVGYYVQTAGQC
jgi:hypothetical protein